jgi:hypothetical protein
MQKIAWDITWDNLGAEHLQTQHAFEPDMIRSMSLALERACEEMGLRPGKDDPATRFVAEKIIKFAQRGIRDPDRLVTLTLHKSFAANPKEPRRCFGFCGSSCRFGTF